MRPGNRASLARLGFEPLAIGYGLPAVVAEPTLPRTVFCVFIQIRR
jgi:hypothetical protein